MLQLPACSTCPVWKDADCEHPCRVTCTQTAVASRQLVPCGQHFRMPCVFSCSRVLLPAGQRQRRRPLAHPLPGRRLVYRHGQLPAAHGHSALADVLQAVPGASLRTLHPSPRTPRPHQLCAFGGCISQPPTRPGVPWVPMGVRTARAPRRQGARPRPRSPVSCPAAQLWRRHRASSPCLRVQEVIATGASVEGIPDIVAQPRGIHSADPARNYVFHNWNHVYVYYCTSDSSLGASLLDANCSVENVVPMPSSAIRHRTMHAVICPGASRGLDKHTCGV